MPGSLPHQTQYRSCAILRIHRLPRSCGCYQPCHLCGQPATSSKGSDRNTVPLHPKKIPPQPCADTSVLSTTHGSEPGIPVSFYLPSTPQMAFCRNTKGSLGCLICHTIIDRQILYVFKYLDVKIRNTCLQRMCHTHLVRFQKDVPLQPEVHVNVLHLCKSFKPLHFS